MGLPVSRTIWTASALNWQLNRRRCSGMYSSSQPGGHVQDPWYTSAARRSSLSRSLSALMDGQTTLTVMRKRTLISLAAGTAATGAAALAYASLVERNMFTLRRVDVPILDTDAEPLRILHLSDLHMTPDQRRKRQWVAALAGTDPDLV